jgi:hypothetical protein
LSKATAPSDPVFTNRDGSQAESLYQALIDDLMCARAWNKDPLRG